MVTQRIYFRKSDEVHEIPSIPGRFFASVFWGLRAVPVLASWHLLSCLMEITRSS